MFFGLLEVDGHSPASFDQMWETSFAVKYNVTGSVGCDKNTFGFDPQPGHAKQCLCDDIGYEDYECIENNLAYWREQREVQWITQTSYSQSIVTTTTTTTTTTLQEETQRKIQEEEEKFARETEERLKKEAEELERIQKQKDAEDAAEHDSDLAADAEAHQTEMEA